MPYRISLHVLATLWHFLLLAVAISRRKSHRYYSLLIPVCIFSGSFTACWALALIFQAKVFIQLSWIGAMWPTSVFFLLKEILGLTSSKKLRGAMWTLAMANFLGGLTPWCIISITSYEPKFVAVVGPIEPWLRVGLIFQISMILWTTFSSIFNPNKKITFLDNITLSGFTLYAVAALFTCALLPLFGDNRFLESTSFYSMIWSTFAMWSVFNELQQQNKALLELDQMKKNFINHVTHEFKTPIHTIESAIDILSGDVESGRIDGLKAADYFSRIAKNTDRLNHFVNELLDLAVIQQAKIKLDKEPVDLLELVKEAIALVKPLADQLESSIRCDGASLIVSCDGEKIKQVVANLISNSLKAAPRSVIHIHVSSNSAFANIRVTDQGQGIAKENLELVFSSFYQVELKTTVHKGSGLGLAIAKGWVEAHGGKIWAKSEGEGKGTTIQFTIPQ